MYTKNLRIIVCAENAADTIRSIDPLPHFSHEIIEYDDLSNEYLLDVDVAIFDFNCGLDPVNMRLLAGPNAKLICCMSQEQETSLSEKDAASLDDIWLYPLNTPRVRMRMKNWLFGIKRDLDSIKKDSWLDTLMDTIPDLVWFKDREGIHHKVNGAFCEFVGKEKDDIEGFGHGHIWDSPEEEATACLESDFAVIRSGRINVAEEKVFKGDRAHLLQTRKNILKGPSGEILGTVGVGHDKTNFLNLDMEMRLFMDTIPLPVVICDENDKIINVNNVFTSFFKEKRKTVNRVPFAAWCDKVFKKASSPATDEKFLRFYYGYGRMRYVDLAESTITDIFGSKIGSIHIFKDITAEKELESKIWQDANTDFLTGLANRHAFGNFCKNLIKIKPINLFYIDLDAFKMVNDTYGHKTGDEALKLVSKTMKKSFRNFFLARLGGDEFVACSQENISVRDLEKMARQFLDDITKVFSSVPALSGMSASIGIRAGADASTPVDTIIRQADSAMYEAKKIGKATYHVWREEGA